MSSDKQLTISSSLSICDALSSALKFITMASSPPSSSSSKSSSSTGSFRGKPIDPITRTALRYTISPREYELLHAYLISRAPTKIQKQTPEPKRYEKIVKSQGGESGDYNAASLRAAIRVFVAAYTGLKAYEVVIEKVTSRRGGNTQYATPIVNE